ncbi:MAG: hypothetical protein IJ281_07345 [Clostridia bacterium]|nr:hypothetical protein [Clostridia bacterium]
MKKIANGVPLILYPLGHAAAISLGAVCFLNVAAITLSPFGSAGSYPRFLPFCVIAGILAFAAWVILLTLNARHLLNHDTYLRWKIALEVALTLLLTPAGMWLWDNLLSWLQQVV